MALERLLIDPAETKLEDTPVSGSKPNDSAILFWAETGIAHELRNVLTPIVGYAELLRGHLTESRQLDDKTEELLELVLENAEYAATLATFLTGTQKYDPKLVQPASFVQTYGKVISRALTNNSTLDIQLTTGALINADKNLLIRLLRNLVRNASQAMPEKGAVLLGVDDKSPHDDKYVCICVKDTGKGISPEHLKKIFQPYFTTKPDGTGLGLTDVYAIAQLHKALLEVETETGKGTTIRVYFPRVEPTLLHHPPNEAQDDSTRNHQ